MRVNSGGYLEYYLEYIDYTDNEKEWIKIFQKNPNVSNENSRESTQLMIRPSFPQWYYRHGVSGQFTNSDITAIVDETWKVGDLVDWLSEGCYWSGRITKLLNQDMIVVKLLAPPIGEGESYNANCTDLRPTLEWSLINGWTVPLSKANRKGWHVARLLRHYQSESEKSTSYEESSSDDEYGDVQQSACRASNMLQESPGPVVLAPPRAEKDAIFPSMENLKPSSTSKSPVPSHGIQSTATSRQPAGSRATVKQEPAGSGVSIKQEHDWSLTEAEADDDGPDEFQEKLDTLQAKLNYLMKRTRVEQERCTEVLASCHGSSKDDVGK